MRRIARPIGLLSIAILLAAFSFATALAQDGDPACSGESVDGTVVAVDEIAGTITLELADGSRCTVQIDTDYDHPITTLLGNYFNDTDPDTIEDSLELLNVEFDCPEGEDCALVDDGSGTSGTVLNVTEVADGVYEVEIRYLDDEGNEQTETVTITDPDLSADLMDALESLQVSWGLKTDENGVFVTDAGDEIAALHDDGMGFGVIVKLYSMASSAAEACVNSGGVPPGEGSDPCEVSLDGLIEAFQNGTGLGQLFQQFGKPAHLGVGHIRQETRDKEGGNQPPDTACGYWKKHGPLSPDHPCYLESLESSGRGKPPWAGSPGGSNGKKDK